MKKLHVVLVVVMLFVVSCAVKQTEIRQENKFLSFQPEPLDDEWSQWLVGKWEAVSGQSDFLGGESEDLGESNAEGGGGFTIELCLNGQFLIWESWTETDEMTDEQKKQLKEAFKKALKEATNVSVSDEELERFVSMPYKSLLIQTVDPKTGERIGYCFDSQRLYGQGRGRLEGNKEIMEWEWSGTGQGVTSVGIIEKINDNKFTVLFIYTLSDGKKMEEKMEMIRKK